MRLVNGVVAFLFLLGVVLQYNDPDPVRWMVIYAAAVTGCVAWEAERARRGPLVGVAIVAILWAAVIAASTQLEVPLLQALSEWDMHSGGSEQVREVGGLLTVGAWMAILAIVPRDRFPAPEREGTAAGPKVP